MARIHPTAVVDGEAQLDDDVTVGAYSIIKGPVRIGAGTVIHEHSHVQGKTVLGKNCEIGPTAFVGLPPQHIHANREIGGLIVGDRVIIRETATVHRSISAGEENATRVGNDCFIMGGVHVAHDCVLEDDVIAANAALVAGHCHIGNKAFLGGGCTLHQYVRVGRLAIIAGNEAISQDVPPFSAARYGGLKAYNAIGCRRAGLSIEAIRAIRLSYRCLHAHRLLSDAMREISERVPMTPEVRELLEFLKSTKRGILPSLGQHAETEGAEAVVSQASSR
jgi:UDP-N-acetylglucosamine acyltransferase